MADFERFRMSTKDTCIALGVVLMMSVNLILQKIAVDHLSVILVGFLRSALVLPFLFIYSTPPERIWRHAFCGFFMVALYLTLFGYGLQTDISANLSAFMLQFQVFFVILWCYILLDEKPSLSQTLGIAIACIGVFLLHNHSSSTELPLLGMVLLIASCASIGLGIALSKKYRLGNSMEDIVWLSALAAPPLLIASFSFDGVAGTFDGIINVSPIALSCVAFATLASTLMGAYLWLNLIQRHSAATITPFMLLVPIFSSIIAYFAFGEELNMQQILSGFTIVIGVIFAQGLHRLVSKPFAMLTTKQDYD